MWWLASPAPTSPDLGVFANYGILGIFALILLGFGFRAWQREIARADRLEIELREKNAMIQDKVIPAVVLAAKAVEESQVLLREMADDRERALRRRLTDERP